MTSDDYNALSTRMLSGVTPEGACSFDDAVDLYCTKYEVQSMNHATAGVALSSTTIAFSRAGLLNHCKQHLQLRGYTTMAYSDPMFIFYDGTFVL